MQSVPLTVGANRSVAEICQILQSHVDQMAKSMHKRGVATIKAATPETDDDLNALTTREFIGSVST